MPKKIALVGGGTGGHVTPIVALTRYIREYAPETAFVWIGEADSMESRFAQEEWVSFVPIASYRIPSMRAWWRMPGAVLRLIIGMWQSCRILRAFHPDVLFSKGGPGAVSVVLMAWILGIPVYLHDSDAIPGISNRFTARFASLIFLGCEEARAYFPNTVTETVGQILDPSLVEPTDSSEMVHFATSPHPNPLPEGEGIKDDNTPLPLGEGLGVRATDSEVNTILKTRIFVICGSQGSKAVYEALIEQMPNLTDFEFIIALGTKNERFEERFSHFENVRALPWVTKENTAWLYREADIVISRGSVTVLAEAAAFGAKIIAIPLPIAAFDHQRANVRSYETQGLCIGLEETELNTLSELLRSNAGRRAYTTPRYDVLEGTKKVAQRLLS